MCIAILCKIGAKLDHDDAEESFRMNRNGGGYAFVDENGKVVANKGFFNFETWWTAYSKDFETYGATSPFLVHFRIATAGKIGEVNCHPFILKEGQAGLIHNGILWTGSMNDVMSDTAKFAHETQDLLCDTPKMTEGMVGTISRLVGYSNKIVLLYADKSYRIINEDAGHWNKEKTIWFSNKTYERWTSTYNNRSGGYHMGGHGRGNSSTAGSVDVGGSCSIN